MWAVCNYNPKNEMGWEKFTVTDKFTSLSVNNSRMTFC